MAIKTTIRENVVRLFQDVPDDLPEAVIDTSHLALRPGAKAEVRPSELDLTGVAKVLMAVGAGSTGKTTLLRWIAERAQDAEVDLALASVDPVNRELRNYFPKAISPKTQDAGETTEWLERFLRWVIKGKLSAGVDFGGGDTALGSLLAQVPNLQETMEGEGVSPVLLYLMSPRVSDVTPLLAMDLLGFKPKATALVLNLGRTQSPRGPEEEFARLRRHSAYKAALDRGAVEVWMPRLYAASAVEAHQALFRQAARGETARPMEMFDPGRVAAWLKEMDVAFAGISRWLP